MTRPGIPEQSENRLTSPQSRALDVPNVRNFRDAGISALKGGLLFRSGSLNRLTDTGVERIRGLGIRTVIDLRSGAENNVWPGQKHGLDVAWIALPALPDRAGLRRRGLSDFSEFDGKDWPLDPVKLYPFMAVYAAPAIARLIKELGRPGVAPVVVQCAVGKDRTGLAMAIIQTLLGVAWQDVVADFVQSNIELALAAGPASFVDEAGVTRYSHPVSEELLRSAIDTITMEHGNLAAYLQAHGVTPQDISALQALLLPRHMQ
ncbi:tyrosine-protein phosphatase [Nonomuraea sp. NPDC046802]|uniref:tyrosine-protein phosphatase n=1 Tax=Nonomuraea sp. NPDC046802 TaxID=3154919 RepID=UPI00340EE037